GELAFPTVALGGGNWVGAQILVSDGVPNGQIIAVDGNAVAASTSQLGVETFREGDVEMSTTPDSPPLASTTRINLWQNDLAALVLRRRFGCELLRTTGASLLSSVNYFNSNSPA